MQCRYHPERDAYITCQKMLTGYCQECLYNGETCSDPEDYCKFRTQCIIWEYFRSRKKRDHPEQVPCPMCTGHEGAES